MPITTQEYLALGDAIAALKTPNLRRILWQCYAVLPILIAR